MRTIALINGLVATSIQCKQLMTKHQPTDLRMESFGDYEENIEWENLEVTYGKDVLLIPEGYTGLWEMASFDKLSPDAKSELSEDLYDWLSDEFEYAEEDE